MLWVDDDARKMLPYSRMLAKKGITVTFSSTVRAAQRKLCEKTFDVVVLDLILPVDDGPTFGNLGGISLLRSIRSGELASSKTPAKVPVVFYTNARRHEVEHYLAAERDEQPWWLPPPTALQKFDSGSFDALCDLVLLHYSSREQGNSHGG